MSDNEPSVRAEVLKWAEENQASVPNLGRLYSKLRKEDVDSHYVHAYYAKKLHDCGCYKISDIEVSGEHDIDIQLNGNINIQVWYGMNTSGHVMESILKADAPGSDDVGKHLGTPTSLGGVPTNFEHDEKKIRKKLDQLPDGTLGILLLHSGRFGYHVPFPPNAMPPNKCIFKIGDIGSVAELHRSPAFNHIEEIKNIAKCLCLKLKI